jgi:prepilin-type N-terminal cleavage/methylation domain-containing protein
MRKHAERLRKNLAVSSGFTLTEVMVVVAILAILLGTAVSSLGSHLPLWRMQGAAGDVVQAFMTARYAAIKNSQNALVTFAGVGGTGTEVKVYLDANRDMAVDGGDTLVQTYQLDNQHPGAFLSDVSDCVDSLTLVAFSATGRIAAVQAVGSPGSMPIVVTVDNVTDTSPDTYQTVIERSGVARVTDGYDLNAACSGDDGKGDDGKGDDGKGDDGKGDDGKGDDGKGDDGKGDDGKGDDGKGDDGKGDDGKGDDGKGDDGKGD